MFLVASIGDSLGHPLRGVSCAIHGRVVRVRNKTLRASPEGTLAPGGSTTRWFYTVVTSDDLQMVGILQVWCNINTSNIWIFLWMQKQHVGLSWSSSDTKL